MNEEITFDDLMQDEEAFTIENENAIALISKDFIEILTSKGKIEFNEKFKKLTGAKKVIIYSLVKKALFYKKIESYKLEEVKTKEIADRKDLGISGSVSKKVFNRELSKFFEKNQNGYFIPNYKIKNSLNYIKNG